MMVVAAAAMVVATSCRLDANVDVSTATDGSGTVVVRAFADAELVGRAPSAFASFATEDARAAGWQTDGVTETADGGRAITLKKSFGTPEEGSVVLAELSGPGGPFLSLQLVQVRKFGDTRTTLTGTGSLESVAALGDDSLVALLGGKQPLADQFTGKLADQVSIKLRLTAPGDATTPEEFEVPLDTATPSEFTLQFVAQDLRAQAARRNAWIAFGTAALMVAGFVALALRWRQKRH